MLHIFLFLPNGFISIGCIIVKGIMNFEGDLEIILVKKRGVKNHDYLCELTGD